MVDAGEWAGDKIGDAAEAVADAAGRAADTVADGAKATVKFVEKLAFW